MKLPPLERFRIGSTEATDSTKVEGELTVDPRGMPLSPKGLGLRPSVRSPNWLTRLVDVPLFQRRAVSAVMLGVLAGASLLGAPVAEAQRHEPSPPTEITRELTEVPSSQRTTAASKAHRTWFSTDWFVADPTGTGRGDPAHNLWAEGGPLAKMDLLQEKLTGRTGQSQSHEKTSPAFFRVDGAAPTEQRGALLSGRVTERYFGNQVPDFMVQVLGDPNATMEPQILAVDFLGADGRLVRARVAEGERLVPRLGVETLKVEKVQVGDRTVHRVLHADGRPLTGREAQRAYFAVVDASGRARGDGQLDGEVQARWWGNCDLAVLAALRLPAPKSTVTRHGVSFTPTDIQGLLTLVMSEAPSAMEFVGVRYERLLDFVQLEDGRALSGEISGGAAHAYAHGDKVLDRQGRDYRVVKTWPADQPVEIQDGSGKSTKIDPAQIRELWVQFSEEISPVKLRDAALRFAQEGGGFADVRSFDDVHNRPFDRAESVTYASPPSWAGRAPREDRYVREHMEWGELTIHFADAPRTYRYWSAKDAAGKETDYGYYGTGAETVPDFIGAPKDRSFQWSASLERNPHVDVELIRSLYEESLRG